MAHLRDAVAVAMTLDERLSNARSPINVSPLAKARYDRWVRYLGGGEEGPLLTRLSWDGFDRERALAALEDAAAAVPSDDSNPPHESLFAFIEEAVAGLDVNGWSARSRLEELLQNEVELPPFAAFSLALVQPVSRRLESRLFAARFSSAAAAQLELGAVRTLASLLQYVLYERFSGQRQAGDSSGGASYSRFVSRLMRGDAARELFVSYSFAARGADLLLRQYEANTLRLAERLEADRASLEQQYGRPLGDVIAVDPGRSDRHEGGQQVAILTFESGLRLVYKPRSVELFAVFQRLLTWLHETCFQFAPPALRVLARPAWGWIEFAVPGEPLDEKGGTRYYERAGALLFLSWLVSARDLHMENVIASPDGPILIDLDAIAGPEAAAGGAGTFNQAQTRIGRSALATGFLSFAHTDAAGRIYEAGGLCGTGGHVAAVDVPVWKELESDALHLVRETRRAEPETNVVTLHGVVQRAEEHSDAIVHGFRAAWDFVARQRDALLAEDGPLRAFRSGRTRVIFRPSAIYAAIHARLLSPALLRDGIEPSLVAETLNRAFVNDLERPALWPLAREERQELLAWDIPIFHVDTTATDLETRSREIIRGQFARSGFDVIVDRAGTLDDSDRDLQCELISASLATPVSRPAGDRSLPDAEPLSMESVIAEAITLSDLIWSRAVSGDDGGVTWIGSRQLRQDDRSDRGVSYYFYDGSPGVALFFAALHLLTGEERQKERAMACVRVVELALRSPHAAVLLRSEGVGGANGIGSIVQALGHLYRLTGDASLLELALLAARFLTPGKITADARLDIEGGAAGALAALLQLFELSGERSLLESAAHAAQRLQASAIDTGDGAAWPTSGGALLAGYAHGAAGIAAALARYGALSGDGASIRLARLAMRYESGVFDRERGNWPLLELPPGGAQPLFMNAWCHGATGGVLARLAMRDVIDDLEIEGDLDAAIETVRVAGAATVDHLCCGTAGRIEALVTAADLLQRPPLQEAARRLVAGLVSQAEASGGYVLHPPPHHRVFEAGFFRGLSGIGYGLLRAANPARIHSILSFAAPVTRSEAWSKR
ncbi:MAG TPA: type 2 lanthipeptide synthetase LanM [Thermoanaerobaculia bacterium]